MFKLVKELFRVKRERKSFMRRVYNMSDSLIEVLEFSPTSRNGGKDIAREMIISMKDELLKMGPRMYYPAYAMGKMQITLVNREIEEFEKAVEEASACAIDDIDEYLRIDSVAADEIMTDYLDSIDESVESLYWGIVDSRMCWWMYVVVGYMDDIWDSVTRKLS